MRSPGCLERSDAGNTPPDTGGVAAASIKKAAKPTLDNAARCRACASRAQQTGAKRERDSAKREKWSGTPKRFVMRDHPVRSIKGGLAASFLMSRPPLLYQEGSWATLRKRRLKPVPTDHV